MSFFGGDFYIASSLYFEESSRQAIHRDTPFFYGHPRATFLGVWFALEDVRLDAGPLTYYPGGHRLVLETRGERSASVNDAWQGYCDRLLNACVAAGIERQQALVKKGTCVIWHPELPHGGSEISRPGASRRSIVFHCAPTDVTLYGVDEFFGFKPIFPKENHIIKNKTGGLMIDQGPPSFAQNG